MKTENVIKDIAEDVERRFDTSNYGADRPLQKEIKKDANGLMKDKLDLRNNNAYCWINRRNIQLLKR